MACHHLMFDESLLNFSNPPLLKFVSFYTKSLIALITLPEGGLYIFFLWSNGPRLHGGTPIGFVPAPSRGVTQ